MAEKKKKGLIKKARSSAYKAAHYLGLIENPSTGHPATTAKRQEHFVTAMNTARDAKYPAISGECATCTIEHIKNL